MRNHPEFEQAVRYGVVGLISNSVLYAAYLGITNFGMDSKLTMSVLYALGIIQSFGFNKRWSFRYGENWSPAFTRYCVVYGVGYLFNLAALFVFVDMLRYPHQIVQGILMLTLAALLFVLQKFWVFRSAVLKKTAARPAS